MSHLENRVPSHGLPPEVIDTANEVQLKSLEVPASRTAETEIAEVQKKNKTTKNEEQMRRRMLGAMPSP